MTAPVDIDALLDAMSLDEQASLLSGADFWHTVAIPRLGVPAVKLSDGPNGARGGVFKDGPHTACFPVGIALAATWDSGLLHASGAALGREALLKGARVLLAPTVNLQRTVYNGRNFECHSEDPWLASEMALAYVRGVQSTGVAATIKHFVGNESEFQRMTISSDIPERALRELYLLPFERAVKQGQVMALMTGYNRLGGTFMADHQRLLTRVLGEEWGFDGLVMTDWFASHDTVQSVLAGCDLEMPGPARQRGTRLVDAVNAGQLPASAVRACAKRVLQLAERVGSFADAVIPAEREDELPEHRALIRQLGAAGTVLLKNDGDLLPLAPKLGQTVALFGWPAVQAQTMGGGSASVNAHRRTAPLEALRRAWPGVNFVHHPGADLHRFTPVFAEPVRFEFYANAELQGPIVATQDSPNGEALWIGHVPDGVNPAAFSCRARLDSTAQADGLHAFSLVTAGRSRAMLNGEPVLDAWSHWTRGDTCFSFGCDELIHRRVLRAGDVVEIEVEFSNHLGGAGADAAFPVNALRIGAGRELDESDIAASVALAVSADVAIVFAGLNAEWDCEGLDRPGIALPRLQNALVEAVAAANPRTVVVLQSGSPLALPWLDKVPAVLQAWYPGQERGDAIADVLSGMAEPAGRLPQTWPVRLEDTVAHGRPAQYPGVDAHVGYDEGLLIGYRHHDAHQIAPLFPFGHGLGYARFDWLALRVTPLADVADTADAVNFEPVWRVEVDLRNPSARAGKVVVQLYLAALDDGGLPALPRPPQWLAGFCALALAPQAPGLAQIDIPARAFASFDPATARWCSRPGRYELRAAASSRDVRLRQNLSYGAAASP